MVHTLQGATFDRYSSDPNFRAQVDSLIAAWVPPRVSWNLANAIGTDPQMVALFFQRRPEAANYSAQDINIRRWMKQLGMSVTPGPGEGIYSTAPQASPGYLAPISAGPYPPGYVPDSTLPPTSAPLAFDPSDPASLFAAPGTTGAAEQQPAGEKKGVLGWLLAALGAFAFLR